MHEIAECFRLFRRHAARELPYLALLGPSGFPIAHSVLTATCPPRARGLSLTTKPWAVATVTLFIA